MKIAKRMILAGTLVGAFQANAMCSVLFGTVLDKSKAQLASIYSRQINGPGTPATPASGSVPDSRPPAKTGGA